jgi:muramoyltetrapeptide carboxypeptidase
VKRAPALRRGDVVRIVAPAGPFDPVAFDEGIAVLERRGYVARFGNGLRARARYLAGSDERRIDEWNEAVSDGEARAIWAARGGFGAMRILDRLDPRPLVRAPKLVVGFSDITAIHGVLGRAGLISVHGPVMTQLRRVTPASARALWGLLEEQAPPPPLRRLWTVRHGLAQGPLFGGNLTLLAHLAGTRYLPRLRGAVLLVEEVRETPYRLDRSFQSLRLSGALDGVAGILLGHVTGCDDGKLRGRRVLEECFASLGVPVASGAPIGHEDWNLAVPLGARVRLDAGSERSERGTLEFLEGAVGPGPRVGSATGGPALLG